MISAPMTAVNIVLTSVCSIITVLILATMEDDKMEDVIPWINIEHYSASEPGKFIKKSISALKTDKLKKLH